MILMQQGKSPRVIMSDISEDSLSKARSTFKAAGLSDRVSDADFRTGDGLMTVSPGEVDEIIIGGLGGHTIVQILDDDHEKSRSFKRLVLQPRKHSGTLRYYLCTHGWDIEKEILAEEGKFACEIITALPTDHVCADAPYPEDDIRWKYPGNLADADHRLARKRIEWKISSITEEIDNLRRSGKVHDDLIAALNDDIEYLLLLNSRCSGI